MSSAGYSLNGATINTTLLLMKATLEHLYWSFQTLLHINNPGTLKNAILEVCYRCFHKKDNYWLALTIVMKNCHLLVSGPTFANDKFLVSKNST